MPAPVFPSPPMNSLPPLRCPAGLDGIGLLPVGDMGDCGGLLRPDSGLAEVVELNVKFGKGGGADRPATS